MEDITPAETNTTQQPAASTTPITGGTETDTSTSGVSGGGNGGSSDANGNIDRGTIITVVGKRPSSSERAKYRKSQLRLAKSRFSSSLASIFRLFGAGKFSNPTGQKVRDCDIKGCGNFGASRVRNHKRGTHIGADYISDSGQQVSAISDGIVIRLPTGAYDGIVVGDGNGISWKILYVDVLSTIQVGDAVKNGQNLGTAQNLTTRYPGITNHVHTKLKIDSQVVNPALFIPTQ